MAGILLQSRFAWLKIDDEDMGSAAPAQKKKLEKKAKASTTKTSQKPSKQQQQPKKKKKKSAPTSHRGDEEEETDGELKEALLESKLDYEKELEKKKNNETLSLDEFNGFNDTNSLSLNGEETSDIIKRKAIDTSTKAPVKNLQVSNSRPQITDEAIKRIQLSTLLEKREEEIEALKEELQRVKKKLEAVKARNLTLCDVLREGEMKDRSELIMEMKRLRLVHREMSIEVTTLHLELEKERSKNTDNKAKDYKKNKKPAKVK